MSNKLLFSADADESRIRQWLTKLGDIYAWENASKACFIALATSLIPITMLLWFSLHYFWAVNHDGAVLIKLTLPELVVAIRYIIFIIAYLWLVSVLATWCVTRDKYHTEILYLTLFSVGLTQSVLFAIIGLFDGVSWLILLIYISIGFVLLTRFQVFITAVSMVFFMILWSVIHDYLPIHVRAYHFTNEIDIATMTWLDLLATWAIVLAASVFCSFILDMLMGAWRHKEKDLHSKSFMDELTSLMNRRAIQDALKEEFFRARRGEYPLSIAMLDLDFFKKVNDNHGHPFGDRVLKLLAAKMTEVTRKKDLLGRYGGEEFLIVFPECEEQQARKILERLRENLAAHSLLSDFGVEVKVTLSAGIAQLTDADQLESLVARADQALYQAKDQGRDRVVYA